ncbi:MAG: hypothetical protein K2Y42_03285 [Hyphomicrobium sp.]|jgi:hypothetical protein|uniref:hypothetical protein n=1 Tax=Hyphomicrobium sp. TaxID=82 RepID=UPI0025B90F16|nr:hypothetical protein [Hyphomicrobium sp.]MBX9861754.1 hypothetical protein [Hyphomicrobium sp.]
MTISIRAWAMACLALFPAVAQASEEKSAVPILFESRQLDLIDKGKEVTYRFEKTGSDERLVGKNFADDLRLGVADVDAKGARQVIFKVFTGDNARDPQNWPDLTINPLFIWYLDRAVGTFNSLAGGSQMYLKHKIREALGAAKVEEIKVDYDGKQVDALKLHITPFAEDPSSQKMQGFHKSTFTIVVSNQVPGYFVDLKSDFVSTQAAGPELREHVKVVGMGDAK